MTGLRTNLSIVFLMDSGNGAANALATDAALRATLDRYNRACHALRAAVEFAPQLGVEEGEE